MSHAAPTEAQKKNFKRLPQTADMAERRELSEPFYVLTDRSYGSNEPTRVRVEVPKSYAQGDTPLEVDMRVYRIDNPLDFLAKQPDLHRIQIQGLPKATPLMPILEYVWDANLKRSRMSWQRIFSAETRQAVVKEQPQLRIPAKTLLSPTPMQQSIRFEAMKEYPLHSQFRYPLWQAKPIQAPKDVKLDGSSSHFISPRLGNAEVNIGTLPAGLYVVEAMVEEQRATTLVFVSDTVAVTKSGQDQMLVWTVNRLTGRPVSNASLRLSDGVGVLSEGSSNINGIAQFNQALPEKNYVYGTDGNGGVFISEQFYEDSAAVLPEVLTVTDKPLYQAGETVRFKAIVKNASASSGTWSYQVQDPNGDVMAQGSLQAALDGQFKLPALAMAGGYELALKQSDDVYSAEFRVAQYIKPHFDMLLSGTDALKTNQPIEAKLSLRYPNGEPVKNAQVQVDVKAQKLSMVDGQLDYAGLFPIQLSQKEFSTDNNGDVTLKLPAATEPSRYVLTLLASDQAAYRVRMTREVLVERGPNLYHVRAAKQFGQAGENVRFAYNLASGNGEQKPVRYRVVRLEDQSDFDGKLGSDNSFDIAFKQSGSYSIELLDKNDNLIGATNYWVQGKDLQAAPLSVEIVPDKTQYNIGDTAQVLLTFPVPVQDALLTLERENVAQHGLLSQAGGWMQVKKLSDKQYQLSIPVTENMAPNMALSVLYQHDNQYAFENAGLVVAKPQLNINVQADQTTYKPKQQVSLDISTLFEGEGGVPADLTVSVVDEMVYVLQPEIAPSMGEFFNHLRRNQVTTESSLNFITYDQSVSAKGAPENSSMAPRERAVKVLERPRRDDQDTALWQPNLQTDASGHSKLTFTLPDALTRWRITVRAKDSQGRVGQRVAHITSSQPYYLKWSSPNVWRTGDQMSADVLVFNQTEQTSTMQWQALIDNQVVKQGDLEVKAGANYLRLPTAGLNGVVTLQLLQNGQVVDSLNQRVSSVAATWATPQQQTLSLQEAQSGLKLPADARNIRASVLGDGDLAFNRALDGLVDYPYGCVEQTASRLIPLNLALKRLPATTPKWIQASLSERLSNQRLRLIDMAGEGAQFSWWGNQTDGDLLMSSYAYYADFLSGQTLGLSRNPDDANVLLELYKKQAENTPITEVMLSLWLMREMGLPVNNLASGANRRLLHEWQTASDNPHASAVFANNKQSLALGVLISQMLNNKAAPAPIKQPVNPAASLNTASAPNPAPQSASAAENNTIADATVAAFEPENTAPATTPIVSTGADKVAAEAYALAQNSPSIALQAALIKLGRGSQDIAAVLSKASLETPTIDRALALIWLQQAANSQSAGFADLKTNNSAWAAVAPTGSGQWQWAWRGNGVPTGFGLNQAPSNAWVVVRYDSSAKPAQTLPVTISRQLYKLEATKIDQDNGDAPTNQFLGFKAVKLGAGEAVSSNQLYVDEITLTPNNASVPVAYALAEVALPPGAQVEGSTWGMLIAGLDAADLKPFANPTYEDGVLSYRVPVQKLEGKTVLRQLVRFGQKGRFDLHAPRLFNMYDPSRVSLATQNTVLEVH